jgi:hypothetical protein
LGWFGPNSGWAAGLRKGVGRGGLFSFLFFLFPISIPNLFKQQTHSEFKPRFESNNQKQCISMHATVNFYISLIN